MVKTLRITVGSDNYRNLVSRNGLTSDPTCLFVDKSKFIADFFKLMYTNAIATIETNAEVLLVTRPRRWGKTLTLSMVQHFLAREVDGQPTKDLFNGSYIQNQPEFVEQGQWPVIFISFKDLKGQSFQEILDIIAKKLSNLFKQYNDVIKALSEKSGNFSNMYDGILSADISKFEAIINTRAKQAELEDSLRFLSELLAKYHNKKVYILIDEYDNAINHAFGDPVLLKELTTFFSNLFGAALKTNPHLKKGMVTGILRVAKANIFSGVNNLVECTVLDEKLNEHYGFNPEEVAFLLEQAGITNKEEIKKWYNGYNFGGRTIYNPWSIMQCIANQGKLLSYWADSGDPELIKNFWIYKSRIIDKIKIRKLLETKREQLPNKTILKRLVSLEDLQKNPEALWSLLLHTGYLTQDEKLALDVVVIPNEEIKLLIQDQIDNWFSENPLLTDVANALLNEDIEGLRDALLETFADPVYSARIFGAGGPAANYVSTLRVKEFIYQFLIMTELRCININEHAKCEVIAEPENISQWRKRPDFVVLNHEEKLCIVGEIKSLAKDVTDEELEEIAKTQALEQAKSNAYGIKYAELGYRLLQIGLAFRGIRFGIAYDNM